ncbi:MAG: hypothetical protein MJ234_05645 [bacterium]|nr:hypothetical protein [bacterium]
MKKIFFLIALAFMIGFAAPSVYADSGFISVKTKNAAVTALSQKYGDKYKKHIERGISQAASVWNKEDGSEEDFKKFCIAHYNPDADKSLLRKYEYNFNVINGHSGEISRLLGERIQLDLGDIQPIDMLFGEISIPSFLSEEYFRTKIAFDALLNYPVTTLEEKNSSWRKWSRDDWAETRLAEKFALRVPADILQKKNSAYIHADTYISSYNIYMNNLLTEDGNRLFPEGLKLISHWGLRDDLKGEYKSGSKSAIDKQKMIQKVMERIIAQEIPQCMVNSDKYDWMPYSNRVFDKNGKEIKAEREPDTRYALLKEVFDGEKLLDAYDSVNKTAIDRHFNGELEMSEKDVENLLLSVSSSPYAKDVGKLIEKRLGRKLLPFDIWYNGFESETSISEPELDKIVAAKYPDRAAFQQGIPAILEQLGFQKRKAEWLETKIDVDPARGAGHAMGAEGREFNAHLRTRFNNDKMNYKSYNVAIHELGHCVEQVHSMNLIDNTLISGIPNIAFTEAFAFVFQSRDLQLLGVKGGKASDDMNAVSSFWKTYEISGVSLVMMKAWRWMYANPNATPGELNIAVRKIAREVWNKYYEPVLGGKDCELLAVYSHMIDCGMYLPNYPIGHIICYQIEDYVKGKNLAKEMERMCVQGNLTPDAWMNMAVGSSVSAKPMLDDLGKALKRIK